MMTPSDTARREIARMAALLSPTELAAAWPDAFDDWARTALDDPAACERQLRALADLRDAESAATPGPLDRDGRRFLQQFAADPAVDELPRPTLITVLGDARRLLGVGLVLHEEVGEDLIAAAALPGAVVDSLQVDATAAQSDPALEAGPSTRPDWMLVLPAAAAAIVIGVIVWLVAINPGDPSANGGGTIANDGSGNETNQTNEPGAANANAGDGEANTNQHASQQELPPAEGNVAVASASSEEGQWHVRAWGSGRVECTFRPRDGGPPIVREFASPGHFTSGWADAASNFTLRVEEGSVVIRSGSTDGGQPPTAGTTRVVTDETGTFRISMANDGSITLRIGTAPAEHYQSLRELIVKRPRIGARLIEHGLAENR